MDHFKVDVVCHGNTPVMDDVDGTDPYAVSYGLIAVKLPINTSLQYTFPKIGPSEMVIFPILGHNFLDISLIFIL